MLKLETIFGLGVEPPLSFPRQRQRQERLSLRQRPFGNGALLVYGLGWDICGEASVPSVPSDLPVPLCVSHHECDACI